MYLNLEQNKEEISKALIKIKIQVKIIHIPFRLFAYKIYLYKF